MSSVSCLTDQNIEDGYLLSHEWPIYVFDAILMAAALAICTTWYVGNILLKTYHGNRDDLYITMVCQPSRSEQGWQPSG
jgi:hypothetical protein